VATGVAEIDGLEPNVDVLPNEDEWPPLSLAKTL